MRRIDWKSVLAAVVTAALTALGVRITLPTPPPPTAPETKPPEKPPVPEPAKDPTEAVGRLVMSGGFCSATPITPPDSESQQVLLSAAHCVRRIGEECTFTTRSGRSVRCRVVAIHRQADACLLLTEHLHAHLPYLPLAQQSPREGSAVLHCGFGIDSPGNVERGRVLTSDTGHDQVEYLLNVSPGDSGGGICLDGSGGVVSPVCCTTGVGRVANVYGARPEVVRLMLRTPASFTDVPPVEMPEPRVPQRMPK